MNFGKMQSPKISVITPNYNHGRFLPEVVDSALSQGYPNLEIIIVDDGSTDNSPEIIEALTADHPEVRPVFLKRNAGVNRAMNRGTQEATGEFAIYRSANDLHFPGFFLSPPLFSPHLQGQGTLDRCRDICQCGCEYRWSVKWSI